MTEQKVKKRDWVKNAAIIFLALMLVLTFFSNTIMNRSLPEVAAEYVQSGVISARIRGTGTVAANESYEVKSLQTREVLSVPVKVGDKVSIGDPLVFYSAAESAQLKEGEAALDALVLAYKKALINSTDGDYAKENRDIQLAQEALDQAKADRDASYVAAAELAAAQGNCSRAKTEADLQQTRVSSLEDQLASLNPGSENSAAINAKRSEVSAAKAKLDAARAVHSAAYGNLESCTVEWMRQLGQVSGDKVSYMEMLNETYAALLNAYDEPSFPTSEAAAGIPAFPTGVGYSRASITAMTAAYAAVDPLQKNYDSLSSELARLIDESSGDYNYNTVKNQLAAARNILTAAQTALAGYESALKALEDKQATYNAALEAVSTNQKALQDLMFALAEQKKADGKTQATEALDLEAQRKQIEEQTKALAELKAGGEGASVESKVNGIVASVSVSAGRPAEQDAVMMVIEVPDMGYGIDISVTNEQSRKVVPGDTAEVTNYYYGEPITATLVAVKSDPQKPTTNKLLSFRLEGAVESGAQLSLSIGERGANYETRVPNSALRSDSNGSFVLAVVPKSGPLGNRFFARRVDVRVLAADDTYSAVSGGITTSDMVISSATKPVEPGTQVRLAE